MPVIANGATSYGEQSKRSYVATGVFNGAFYSYTSARDVNNVTQYTFAVNPLATASNCKAGHILKENGRKLVPGANPSVTNYMVGVFDSSSLLNGFIDPNNSLFAVYSTNTPNFVTRGVDTVTGPDGTTNDMGPPVYTSGTVTAEGNVTSVAGNVVATAGNIIATAGNIIATAGSISAATTATAKKYLTLTVGSSTSAGSDSSGYANLNGTSEVIITTTQVTTSSLIFITVNNNPGYSTQNVSGGGGGQYRIAITATAVPGNGSFKVYGSADGINATFYWFIVN